MHGGRIFTMKHWSQARTLAFEGSKAKLFSQKSALISSPFHALPPFPPPFLLASLFSPLFLLSLLSNLHLSSPSLLSPLLLLPSYFLWSPNSFSFIMIKQQSSFFSNHHKYYIFISCLIKQNSLAESAAGRCRFSINKAAAMFPFRTAARVVSVSGRSESAWRR